MPFKNSYSIYARWSKSGLKDSMRFCAIFPSLKQNYIAYRSSKVNSRPDCIFELHQLWQSDFSRVYSNCCCSCLFEPEIIKIGQSSLKMYSNNIVNFQECSTILNACTKNSGNLLKEPRISKTPDPFWRMRRWKFSMILKCKLITKSWSDHQTLWLSTAKKLAESGNLPSRQTIKQK